VVVAPGTASPAQALLTVRYARTASWLSTVFVEDVLLLAPTAIPQTSPSALAAQVDSTSPSLGASPAAQGVSPASTIPHVLPASPDTLPTPTAPASSLASPPV
jgi:hypothetical protein